MRITLIALAVFCLAGCGWQNRQVEWVVGTPQINMIEPELTPISCEIKCTLSN